MSGAVEAPDLVLDPREPLVAAREFLGHRHMVGGLRTLHYYRGEFFGWGGTAYTTVPNAEIRARLYGFLDEAKILKDGQPEPYRPNQRKVADVKDALKAAANLAGTIDPPAWLKYPPDMGPAAEYLAVANGLLQVPTRELHAPTPAFQARCAIALFTNFILICGAALPIRTRRAMPAARAPDVAAGC